MAISYEAVVLPSRSSWTMESSRTMEASSDNFEGGPLVHRSSSQSDRQIDILSLENVEGLRTDRSSFETRLTDLDRFPNDRPVLSVHGEDTARGRHEGGYQPISHRDEEYTDSMETRAQDGSQPQNHGIEHSKSNLNNTRSLPSFTPFWLRKSTLYAFAALFTGLILALSTILIVSEKNDGLASTTDQLYYLWRFGPTSLLIIIIAFWGQVELRIKQLIPWHILHEKRGSWKETIELDYLDPWVGIAFYKAVKARHWLVVAVIGGSLTLAFSVIAASGLLHSQYVPTTIEVADMVVTSYFDMEAQDNLTRLEAEPLSTWAGIMRLGLDHPLGSTNTIAYQRFNVTSMPVQYSNRNKSSSLSSSLTMTAEVNVFNADLVCDVILDNARIDLGSSGTINDVKYYPLEPEPPRGSGYFQPRYYVLEHKSCSFIIEYHFLGRENTTIYQRADSFFSKCDRKSFPERIYGESNIPRERSKSYDKLLFMVFDPLPNNVTIRTTAVLCLPKHIYGPGKVTLSYWGNSSMISYDLPQHGTFKNLTDLGIVDLVQMSIGSLGQNGNFFKPGGWTDKSDLYHGGMDTSFHYINLPDPRPLVDYLDANLLIRRARAMLSGLSAQTFRYKFSRQARTIQGATMKGMSQRLVVSRVSCGLMIFFLVEMITIAVFLAHKVPRSVTPWDPSSLRNMMLLLCKSPCLLDTHSSGPVDAKARLGPRSLGIHEEASCFGIDCETTDKVGNRYKAMTWWTPFSISMINRVLIIIVVTTTIVVLEVLWRLSQRSNGLAQVPPSMYIDYLWTYTPTLITILVGSLMEGVNFVIRVMEPFYAMRAKAVRTNLSIMDEKLSGVALSRLFDSVRKRQLAMFISSVAGLITPLLTIAVSGLYLSELRPHSEIATQIDLLDTFEFNESVDYLKVNLTDNQRLRQDIPSMMIGNGLAAPLWTTRSVALPRISVQGSTFGIATVNLTAIRGQLNCSFSGDHDALVQTVVSPYCASTDQYGNCDKQLGTFLDLSIVKIPKFCDPIINSNSSVSGSIGRLFEASRTSGKESSYINPACLIGYAFVGNNDTALGPSSVKLAHCSPFFETVTTEVIFSLPNYAIRTINIKDDSARFLGRTSIRTNIPYPSPNSETRSKASVLYRFSTQVLSMLTSGSSPAITFDDFRNGSRHQHILDALHETWQVEAAQNADILLRKALPQAQRIRGIITDNNRKRVVQSQLATRLSQGLLVAVLILMIMLFILRRRANKTIPWGAPTNVAVVASLLAGSRVMQKLADDDLVQCKSIEELDKSEILGLQNSFSMQWRMTEAGQRLVIDVENSKEVI